MIASYYAFYIGLRKENQKLTDFAHFVAYTQCLKITQNVAFEFFQLWHF